MTIDEMIAVLTAHKEGKAIQATSRCNESGWFEIKNPSWDFSAMEYRIKPEKKIIPYETFEELYNDMEKHGGKFGMVRCAMIIRSFEKDYIYRINTLDPNHVIGINISGMMIDYKDFLTHFRWFDGSPCGKEVEK